MIFRPAAAEHAYGVIKAGLLRGRFVPGAALNVHTLALEMGLSISPVRDAMGRLVGEHLIALRPEGGFQMPVITAEGVSELYKWNARLLSYAIREPESERRDAMEMLRLISFPEPDAIVTATADVFGAVASYSSNSELRRSVDAMSDRLAPLRQRETMIRDRGKELLGIVANAVNGHDRRLHESITRYHKRRLSLVGAAVAMLYVKN